MKLTNKIGVIVDGFRLPVREGLQKAKSVGADGVQIFAVHGEMDPDHLSHSSRQELKKYIDSLRLEVTALCGDIGHGFQDRSINGQKIEKSKRILDLAVELGTNIVTTHIGIIPEDEHDPIYEAMQAACAELSAYASSLGAHFAVETGPETTATLKRFLDSFNTKGVAVNFDPANLVMVTGDDPVEGVKLLRDYIVHTHVKDGIRYKPIDPREVYGSLGFESKDQSLAKRIEEGEFFREVPLGEGTVDFDAYFTALQEMGYTGYLTIEREVGQNPEHDISKAVQFIRKFKE
ncbi:hypothetical protein J14TS5_02220 [Paenibacillus lautus]|uniref:sugar phosphate isomerase/epimerase family protein n=1 Tax=Paenibacillus lautus TaxID=1401 RepID=UPI001B069795|nr:sugar phosphate isomerase/epimerase family protein [Paenibacillus lautus]GIO95136.1 hypothetical protein J14TS5_02220 [Paenibacillus lautus]